MPFTSPSHITTGAALHAVCDTLKSGICSWIPLTCESRETLVQCVESGDIAKKPHAQWANKGTKYGPQKPWSGKENIPPTKAHNALVRSIPPCSAEFVDKNGDD